MRHRTLLRIALLLPVLWVMSVPGLAKADDVADCFTGQLGQRIPACTAVIEDPTSSPFELERALDIRSVDLAIVKRFAEAMDDLNRVLKLNPNSATALNGRAWTLFRWKNTTDGMADVNRALQLDGTLAPAWDTRAHFYQMLGNFEKAFTEYEAAVGFGGIPFIRIYQCGLKERGLYKGPVDGIYSTEMRKALRACAFSATCDPLPENEYEQECENVTS
jgi:tetratricopeptide (TPR) repeat protein